MASAAVRYARTIRPFPVKRLADVTYYVMADGNAIWHRVTNLMIDQPGTPEVWYQQLQLLLGELLSLRDRIDELMPQLTAMQDSADRDYEVAVSAMEMILRGLQVIGEPPDLDGGVEAAEPLAA